MGGALLKRERKRGREGERKRGREKERESKRGRAREGEQEKFELILLLYVTHVLSCVSFVIVFIIHQLLLINA